MWLETPYQKGMKGSRAARTSCRVQSSPNNIEPAEDPVKREGGTTAVSPSGPTDWCQVLYIPSWNALLLAFGSWLGSQVSLLLLHLLAFSFPFFSHTHVQREEDPCRTCLIITFVSHSLCGGKKRELQQEQQFRRQALSSFRSEQNGESRRRQQYVSSSRLLFFSFLFIITASVFSFQQITLFTVSSSLHPLKSADILLF